MSLPVSPPLADSFWRTKTLEALSPAEWEALCDGCGKCCLIKLEEDDDSDVIAFTCVACELLDPDTARCLHYENRRRWVPDCVQLTPAAVRDVAWLPQSCAYRLVAEGQDLPWWHPLQSGTDNTVHLAGASVRYRVISEKEVADEELEDFIVDWAK